MRILFTSLLLVASSGLSAQIFESQIANSNPAYTAMMDDRFADFSLSGIFAPRFFGILNLGGSYQQNFEKFNSGLGISLGGSRIFTNDTEDFSSTYTALSYRYALNFENGLRLAGATRFSYSRVNSPYFNDSTPAFPRNNFGVNAGVMASYKDFTFGLVLPQYGNLGWNNFLMINASYRKALAEKIDLTAISSTYLSNSRNFQSFRVRAEFNKKFWFASGVHLEKYRGFGQQFMSFGLSAGFRIKKHFHLFAETDFSIGKNAFSVFDPRIGFIYQFGGRD